LIASLADAWRWYEAARALARAMARLGEKHWNDLPWDGALSRDNFLRHLSSAEILNGSQTVLDDLDDLCVLLLFSVFEATIRERVLAEVEAELPPLRHVAIKRALDEMKEGIEHGAPSNLPLSILPRLTTASSAFLTIWVPRAQELREHRRVLPPFRPVC